MDEKAKAKRFTLTIPLDASAIEDLKSGGRIKLAAKDTNGRIHSQTVKIDAKRKAEAKFTFSTHPGSLHVVFGPADADDDELFGLQTSAGRRSMRLRCRPMVHLVQNPNDRLRHHRHQRHL